MFFILCKMNIILHMNYLYEYHIKLKFDFRLSKQEVNDAKPSFLFQMHSHWSVYKPFKLVSFLLFVHDMLIIFTCVGKSA